MARTEKQILAQKRNYAIFQIRGMLGLLSGIERNLKQHIDAKYFYKADLVLYRLLKEIEGVKTNDSR